MIPREVVARNRNRYICNETAKKQECQADQDTANTSDTMDNDSDDGYATEKINTSFRKCDRTISNEAEHGFVEK